jgi:hypothetical protein
LVNYMLDLTVGYSTAPLRLASAVGLISVVVALLVGLFGSYGRATAGSLADEGAKSRS